MSGCSSKPTPERKTHVTRGGKTRRSDASRACIRSSVWVTAARRRNCPPWHTRSMECAHCGHAGPVHATALDPQASPRVFCDDCRSCGLLADQAGLPVRKFRRSHLQLLRVLSALTNAGASEWVGRDALTGGHSHGASRPQRRSINWIRSCVTLEIEAGDPKHGHSPARGRLQRACPNLRWQLVRPTDRGGRNDCRDTQPGSVAAPPCQSRFIYARNAPNPVRR
jgi:hypothetical protein